MVITKEYGVSEGEGIDIFEDCIDERINEMGFTHLDTHHYFQNNNWSSYLHHQAGVSLVVDQYRGSVSLTGTISNISVAKTSLESLIGRLNEFEGALLEGDCE
ncbi:hypothetical protein CMI42_01630 [Candidatus Pacearchaeota archaeon]|nr:hypothetical protein [Candidatus Pacearchaeota archaeon]|tara:strand:- start:770 stop:1078 length:309 start_codon:yes stop_codon:yes gene_type:complete